MAWGDKGNQEALDDWVKRLTSNDASFTSLHVLPARRLTPEQFATLFAALGDNKTLTELYCARHSQSDESLLALAEALRRNTTLERLAVGGPHLAEEAPAGCAALCAAAGVNNTLQELDLDNKGLGVSLDSDDEDQAEVVGQALSDMIASSKSLRRLNLARNSLEDVHIQLVTQGLKENIAGSGRLARLNLGYNALGVASARALAAPYDGDRPNGGLQELVLSGNEAIGVDGLALLGAALRDNTLISTCRKLELADMAVAPTSSDTATSAGQVSPGDAFLEALADTTRGQAPVIESLCLDRSGITAAGARALGRLLSDPSLVLSAVTLRGNALGDEGVKGLAVNVSNADAPGFSLDLSENGLTDAALHALLTQSQSITKLALFGNHISLDSLPDLAQLTQLSRLTLLDLSRNRISSTGFNRLADLLIQGAFPALTQLEIAGNVDARQTTEDGTEASNEVKAWSATVHKLRDARPDLTVSWR
jgi:Leucine-rich repeat (LRR) protein